jgi:hypothetical protein
MKFDGTFGTNFSGSLAGITASHNKGGAYLRNRALPVQPNTIAQLEAKASFGVNPAVYATFSSTEKAQWGQFAQTLYVSRRKANVGQFSGYNAYVALATAFSNQVRLNRAYDLTVNGAVLAGGDTRTNYGPPGGLPPLVGSAPTWQNSAGFNQILSVIGGVFKLDGAVSMTFQVGDGLGSNMTNFLNPNDEQFGIAIYASNANSGDNMNHKKPEQYLMGYFDIPIATVPADLNAVEDFTIASNDAFPTGKYQTFPLFGQFLVLTAYMVTGKMQMDKIGVIEVDVSS